MPKCPKCGREMATVLHYRAARKRTYYAYECTACEEKAAQSEPAEPEAETGGADQQRAAEERHTRSGS